MARTPSQMIPLGTSCPTFRLPDTDGQYCSSDQALGSAGLLVIFMCNTIPI